MKSNKFLLLPLLLIFLSLGISAQTFHMAYDHYGNGSSSDIEHFPTTGFIQTTIFNPQQVDNGTVLNNRNLMRSGLIVTDYDLNLTNAVELMETSETDTTIYQIQVYDVEETPSGFIVAGAIFDHNMATVAPRGLVVEVDPSLNILWSHTYMQFGEIQSIIHTPNNGGYLAVGYTLPSPTSTFKSARMIRLDNVGNVLWAADPQFPPGAGESIYHDVVKATNQDIYYAVGGCHQIYGPSLDASEVLATSINETTGAGSPFFNSVWYGRTNPSGQKIVEEAAAVDADEQGNIIIVGQTYYENFPTVGNVDQDLLVSSISGSLSLNWSKEYTLKDSLLTFETANDVNLENLSEVHITGVVDNETFYLGVDLTGMIVDHRHFYFGTDNHANGFTESLSGFVFAGGINGFGSGAMEKSYAFEYEPSIVDTCSQAASPFVRDVNLDEVILGTANVFEAKSTIQIITVPKNVDVWNVCVSDFTVPPCPAPVARDTSFDVCIPNLSMPLYVLNHDTYSAPHGLDILTPPTVGSIDSINIELGIVYYKQTFSPETSFQNDFFEYVLSDECGMDTARVDILCGNGGEIDFPEFDIWMVLEGLFNDDPNGAIMTNFHATGQLISPFQPFDIAPWNYPGSESLGEGVGQDISAWVLVEFRDGMDPNLIIARKAGILRTDGKVVDTDGSPFDVEIGPGAYYVVVHAQGHLPMQSANPVQVSPPQEPPAGTVEKQAMSWNVETNFSDPSFPKFGMNGFVNIEGFDALIAGDANNDGIINAVDINTLITENGNAYQANVTQSDINADGTVNAVDFYQMVENFNVSQTVNFGQ